MIGTRLDYGDIVQVNKTAPAKHSVLENKLVTDCLNMINWVDLLQIECPRLIYNNICTLFENIYSKCQREVCNKNKRLTQPWVNKSLERMIDRKNVLFRLWKADSTNSNMRLQYTKYRNTVNRAINKARNIYRQQEIKLSNGDFRKIWGHINAWLGRKKASIDETIKKHLGRTDTLYNICTKFSNTFTQEIVKIKHNCNKKFLNRNSYVRKSEVSFRYRKVDPIQIEKIIDQLDCKKAPGVDKIRVQDLKYVKKDISIVLAKFINLCIPSGIYPDELKRALIRPIFKQGCHLDYSNYRPVAILPAINKIVEKVIVGQIGTFLEQNTIISNSQHGFRRGRSTGTALTLFTDFVNNELDKGNQILALFVDYKKAFDTLDHKQLLQAMEECGVGGPTNDFLRSYLCGRTLCTVVDETRGAEAAVTLGVPTGSVYGPLGYIVHVNAVANVVRHAVVYMYADDMCLLVAGTDVVGMQARLQEDFDNITMWAHDNGIILNTKKTQCMHLYSPYNRTVKGMASKNLIGIKGHSYECYHNNKNNCNCPLIETVDKFKYLGLWIDNRFNWKVHVNSVCDTLRAILCKLFHLKDILDRKTLRMLYHALVDALISYGLSCYGLTFKTYIEQIKKLQVRCIKYIVSKNVKSKCKDDYNKLFQECKIIPVDKKVEYLIALETYYSEEFKIKIDGQHNTRSKKEGMLRQTRVSNYYGERTRKYVVPKLYNKYKDILMAENVITSKVSLKKKLRDHFMKYE